MRVALLLPLLAVLAGPPAFADPPRPADPAAVIRAAGAAPALTLPAEVKGEPGEFVALEAATDGKVVRFVALDPGLNRFPPALLVSCKAAVFTARLPGRYRVLAYTAVADEPSEEVICTLVIGDPKPVPPGPTPPGPVPPGPVVAPFPGAKLLVKVVADRTAMPPATADLLASATLRRYLADRGHEFELLAPGSEAVQSLGLAPFVTATGGPPALVLMLKDGPNRGLVPKQVGAVRLPASEPLFVAAVEAVTGK